MQLCWPLYLKVAVSIPKEDGGYFLELKKPYTRLDMILVDLVQKPTEAH